MKQQSRLLTALVTALLVSGSGGAQMASPGTTKKPVHSKKTVRSRRATTKKVPVESETTRQLRELQQQIAGQQAQIDQLRTQLSTANQQAVQSQQSVAEAQSTAAAAQAATVVAAQQGAQNAQDVQQLKTSVADVSTQNTSLQQTIVQTQQQVQQDINSPTVLHYKGVTIQPVAFAAFEGVWRQHSVNSDINTPFNTIPMPSATQGHVSELNFSGRQSRLGALFTGDAGHIKLSSYFESDFLGAGVTSNNNQSNSYVFRVRQFWGQAARRGTIVTGGQTWSLATEDARGDDPRTEVLPNTIDSQYMVGFTWERQPTFRVEQRFGEGNKGVFTLAGSVEQAQITNFTATSATSGAVPTNFFFAGAGQNGGLYNAFNGTYANNVAPDVIVKGAYDYPHIHAEFGGLARFMNDKYYPIQSATVNPSTGAVSYVYASALVSATSNAGGAFGSIRVFPTHTLEVGFSGMGGTGVGRYGSSQLADATVKPSGALEPIRNYHGLFSLVTHEGKNLDIFAYYGGEYDQRTVYRTQTGALIGYGAPNLNNAGCYALPANPGSSTGGSPSSPSTCASPTRYIQEPMFGFIYRAVNSPKYGRLQYSATYSYLQRNLWSGSVSTPVATAPSPTPTGPRAQENMLDVQMRYYIP